ncbi:glutathione S-transferase family protein [Cohaesibacter celericrescens]|uniref:Glutathione S-transferase n=1 Tax=Cohaesibacter celericrescens TaxID=2067669 RepID=A0A2N5XTI7_9HYPH|nr:glutathione S-transferase family protein [Cohaesibacter celericrescens]PLW77765.1 glutathione S-transferase [Cohaesibacter celericrescens]
MLLLYHNLMSVPSRFVRLVLAECKAGAELTEILPWDRKEDFLLVNPAGSVPVLRENDGPPVCSASVIAEYLDETRGYSLGTRRLLPDHPNGRAEVRRLMQWFLEKAVDESGQFFIEEKIYKRMRRPGEGGGPPDSTTLRAARGNLKIHLKYIAYLAERRNWLAGEQFSYADLAAGAFLSTIDYLGEVPWDKEPVVKDWYQRIKSRPAFRPILADSIKGIPAANHYMDLDF